MPSMPPQSVGWTEKKVAVSFHSAEWIFQKEMALKKRRPKEGKVGGELQITQKYGTEGPTNIQGEARGSN